MKRKVSLIDYPKIRAAIDARAEGRQIEKEILKEKIAATVAKCAPAIQMAVADRAKKAEFQLLKRKLAELEGRRR